MKLELFPITVLIVKNNQNILHKTILQLNNLLNLCPMSRIKMSKRIHSFRSQFCIAVGHRAWSMNVQ